MTGGPSEDRSQSRFGGISVSSGQYELSRGVRVDFVARIDPGGAIEELDRAFGVAPCARKRGHATQCLRVVGVDCKRSLERASRIGRPVGACERGPHQRVKRGAIGSRPQRAVDDGDRSIRSLDDDEVICEGSQGGLVGGVPQVEVEVLDDGNRRGRAARDSLDRGEFCSGLSFSPRQRGECTNRGAGEVEFTQRRERPRVEFEVFSALGGLAALLRDCRKCDCLAVFATVEVEAREDSRSLRSGIVDAHRFAQFDDRPLEIPEPKRGNAREVARASVVGPARDALVESRQRSLGIAAREQNAPADHARVAGFFEVVCELFSEIEFAHIHQ